MKRLLLIIGLLVIAALIRGRLRGRSAAGTSPVVDGDDGMRASSVVGKASDAGEADVDAGHPGDVSSDSGSTPQAFASLTTAVDGVFGTGSADPAADGSRPAGYDIKGNADSMLYHPTDSPYFGRTKAEVWFDSETSADAAGFTRWDQRDRNAGGSRDDGDRVQAFAAVVVPDGPFGPGSADPADDGSGPAGYGIKGNADSMLYHTTESAFYDVTKAEVWFKTEEAARNAGFRSFTD